MIVDINLEIPDAYLSLILGVLEGEHSNFVRNGELEQAWEISTPLLHTIDDPSTKLPTTTYPYGSKGPDELYQSIKKYVYDHANESCLTCKKFSFKHLFSLRL